MTTVKQNRPPFYKRVKSTGCCRRTYVVVERATREVVSFELSKAEADEVIEFLEETL